MPDFNDFHQEFRESLEFINTREEMQEFFNEKLPDLDYNSSVKKYVSVLMTDFAYARGNELISVLYNENLERVRIKEFFDRRAFIPLKNMGDAFLWCCGFFPEHVIDKSRNQPRFNLTLDDYIGYGRDAYSRASLLSGAREFPVGEISQRFKWVVHSMINMRDKINPRMKYSMHPDTIKEIERVVNNGEKIFETKESLILPN
jgi:hypothetical protein